MELYQQSQNWNLTILRMKRLYRNPGTWLSLAIFGYLSFLFFRYFPITASVTYGSLILYIATRQIRSSLRLRRQGYRIRGHGPEMFRYEEMIDDGEIRQLKFGLGHLAGRKVGIYWPSNEAWQRDMPDWAKGRREEIYDRIRGEFGSRLVKCIETE